MKLKATKFLNIT